MAEFITLSSDSDGEKGKEEEKEKIGKKRKSINGIPRSFENDKRMRFSFGVTDSSILENRGIEEEKKNSRTPENEEEESKNDETLEFDDGNCDFDNLNNDYDYYQHSMEPIEEEAPYNPPMTPKTPTTRSRTLSTNTPKSIRRRSMSVTCLSTDRNTNKKAATNVPPVSKICSAFVEEEEDFGDEKEEEEDLNLRALLSPEKGGKGGRKKRGEKIEEVQNEFYGVYCLISRSERPCYKNRCYIGYTVDPNRRIMQHNGGRGKGGAKKTDSRGPWDMVCVIHGFPNHVAALRFEWAWQNPNNSKIIKQIGLKKERKETPFAYQLRIACHLMNSQPFARFALTFRWLITKEELPFPSSCKPPTHIKKKYGKVQKEMSLVPSKDDGYVGMDECRICGKDVEKIWHLVRCIGPQCTSHFHAKCLADSGLKTDRNQQLFPLNGNCPTCGHFYLWGDIVREQRKILKVSHRAAEEFKELVVKKRGGADI